MSSVFTLGVAPCFFSSATGEFMPRPSGRASSRSSSLNKEYVWRKHQRRRAASLKEFDCHRRYTSDGRMQPGSQVQSSRCRRFRSPATFNYESVFERPTANQSRDRRCRVARSIGWTGEARRPLILYWPSFEAFRLASVPTSARPSVPTTSLVEPCLRVRSSNS